MDLDDTTARFPRMAGGYESFYLRACRPEGGLGLWLRHTVHRRPGHPPTGSVWFTLFDADAAAPVAAKVTVRDPTTGSGDWIRVAGARIGVGGAAGRIALDGGTSAAWELSFTGEPALRHLPRGWLYRAPLPRTKSISLHPAARFDGTLTVAGRTIDLAGWSGMVGHNWGSQHAERWIWLHGLAPGGAWLDVVLGRLRLAGRTTPWMASGALCLEGERLRLGGPLRTRTTTVDEAPDRVDFALPGRDLLVTGRAEAPRERFVGWIYADPDGSEHHTVNCSIADLTLTVARRGRPPVSLRVAGTAAYELGLREHDHGLPIQPFSDG